MLIYSLAENTAVSPEYKTKHGLSLYIETQKHKLLFDLGPNDCFLKNAEKLGVDISSVDTVIISHGHNDHAGALKLFLEKNDHAKIYVRKNAFEEHTTKVLALNINISPDKRFMEHPQVILTQEQTKIDEELFLFSDIKSADYLSKSNEALMMKKGGKRKIDDFSHEQNLILSSQGKTLLFAGCAHRGIVNILSRATDIAGHAPDICIGGFHLFNPVSKKKESDLLVTGIASEIKKYSTVYYTCHCTGKAAFDTMKATLGERLNYLSAGGKIDLR